MKGIAGPWRFLLSVFALKTGYWILSDLIFERSLSLRELDWLDWLELVFLFAFGFGLAKYVSEAIKSVDGFNFALNDLLYSQGKMFALAMMIFVFSSRYLPSISINLFSHPLVTMFFYAAILVVLMRSYIKLDNFLKESSALEREESHSKEGASS